MQKSEFVVVANKLKAAYPREAFAEQYMFDTWYECLQDLETRYVDKAVVDLIKTMKFCPKISEIREKYDSYDKRTDKERYEDELGLQ